ncbi:IucC family-domain-containing protein [Syncephalis plumigaleata]|nr:IucC family-domain-containing protein [Syncephalis plumigaleata]
MSPMPTLVSSVSHGHLLNSSDLSNKKASKSIVPARFYNTTHQAHHATFSRLLSCVVNEQLVDCHVITGRLSTTSSSSSRLWCWIRTPSHEPASRSVKTGDFMVPLYHYPIVDKHEEGRLPHVSFLHPEDLETVAYVVVSNEDANNNDNKHAITLSSEDIDGQSVLLTESLDACQLMRAVGHWQQQSSESTAELCGELASSMNQVEYAFEHRNATPTLASTPIQWEQSIVEGHATHPMHKARFALPPLEALPVGTDLSMLDACFVSVPRDDVTLRGDYEHHISRLMPKETRAAIPDASRYVVLPAHPRQLPNIFARFPQVKLLPGTLPAKAQASLRTVVPVEHPEWAIKLCLGIKVTSALRTITPWTTHMGPGMIGLLDKLVADNADILKVAKEVASAVITHPDTDVAKHLSCIIREEAIQKTGDNEHVIVCAALVERNANGVPFVVTAFNLDTEAKRVAFFERYAALYLKAFLTPAHKYGFAFEAHGQNTLARFDKQTGKLVGFVVRDFGGVMGHQETLKHTLNEQLDVLPDSCCIAGTLDKMYDLIYHTAIQCHLHSLIRALGLHYNGKGWQIVRDDLCRIVPVDSGLYRFFIKPRVELKCFVKMKMQGLYRDYVYLCVPNVLLYRNENDTEWDDEQVQTIMNASIKRD